MFYQTQNLKTDFVPNFTNTDIDFQLVKPVKNFVISQSNAPIIVLKFTVASNTINT
mgnify:CR=1 FL=1